MRWSINDKDLADLAIDGSDQASYKFDMQDAESTFYSVDYVLSDAQNHDYWVEFSQRIQPA